MDVQTMVRRMRERFPDTVIEVVEFRGETTLVVEPEMLLEAATFLRDRLGFDMLSDVCAVDHLPRQPRFDLHYQLYSMKHNVRLRLQVRLPEERARVQSVTGVWPAANWYEREVYDLFGIEFAGHPDLRRLLLSDDFLGHPLRRDYIGTYVEEVQFTHNLDEIDRQKPYALRNT